MRSDADPADLDATALARAIARGRLSALAAVEACLARLRTCRNLNIVVAVDEQAAYAAARHADRLLRAGRRLGPLHGVPLAHKDMFFRKGRVSACGSAILARRSAKVTATALRRLDAAGAIELAQLNMSEFAYNPFGLNDRFGHCRNPADSRYITVGSSSGSAAAVAARMVPAALGSDTGGSVRLPASACGVVGIKPTYGRVSRYGTMPLCFSLDCIGVLARSVRDCALLLSIVAGWDENDPTSSRLAVSDYVAARRSGRGARIGVPEAVLSRLDPPAVAAFDVARGIFARAGFRLVRVEIASIDELNALATIVQLAEVASLHEPWLRDRYGDYMAATRERMLAGFEIPATRYLSALSARGKILAQVLRRSFARCDAIALPTLAHPLLTIDEAERLAPKPPHDFARLTRPFNYLGLPVLSLPCAMDAAGMPSGIQLVGRPFAEATLFALGAAYERAALGMPNGLPARPWLRYR